MGGFCLLVGRGDNRAVTELGFAHVTTKTWVYSGVFSFFRNFCWQKKLSPPHQNHFLKIQWEIHFLERHFLGRNTPKQKKFNRSYIALYQKTVFRFDPGPWEVPKPENT